MVIRTMINEICVNINCDHVCPTKSVDYLRKFGIKKINNHLYVKVHITYTYPINDLSLLVVLKYCESSIREIAINCA